MQHDPQTLYTEWSTLRREKKHHALETARALGVAEAVMLATACGASGDVVATRLVVDVPKFFHGLCAVGRVKAITRNAGAVLEIEGEVSNVEFFGAMGQAIGTVDLRIFPGRVAHAFSVVEETPRGPSRSFQLFDAEGTAVHKVYARPDGDAAAWDALVRSLASSDQAPVQQVTAPDAGPPPSPDGEIDVDGLRTAWKAMTDTHEFFGLLRRFNVQRTQAFRMVGGELAVSVLPDVATRVLHAVAAADVPFMIFVGNPGVIQIHSGPIRNVRPLGTWINVLDPGMNLHLDTGTVTEAWLVRKPTADGVVTSVELYDRSGAQIALYVGKRKPGQNEDPAWRAIAESMIGGVAS